MAPTGNAGDENGKNSCFPAGYLEKVYANYLSPSHIQALQMLEDNPVDEDVYRVEEFGDFLTRSIKSLNNQWLEIELFNMLHEKAMKTSELLTEENKQLKATVETLERENDNLRSLLGTDAQGSLVSELQPRSKM